MRRLIELIGVGLVAGLAVALALPVVAQDTFITGTAILDGPNPLVLNADLTSENTMRLAPGPPETWQYISGAGTWSGVSPPTTIGTRSALLTVSTSTWQDVVTLTADVPAATSDVLISGSLPLTWTADSQCFIRIRRGSTTVLGWGAGRDAYPGQSLDTWPIEFQYVDTDPGAGSFTYALQVARIGVADSCDVSVGGALTFMVAQVYQ